MDDRLYLDSKYSLFGDFASLQNNIAKYSAALGDEFKKELSNEVLPPNIVSPLYIFDSNQLTIRVGKNRLDFGVKQNFESSIDFFGEMLDGALPYFSGLSRIAINTTFFVNGDTKLLAENLFGANYLSAHFSRIKEFLRRDNYESSYRGLAFNNILAFGPDEIIDKETFAKFNVVLFSIDINSVPLADSNPFQCSRDDILDFYKYMLSNYMVFIEYVDRICGFERGNA